MAEPSRFGFQKPKIATTTTSRTTRIPGTNTTRTESRTEVTQVTPCPSTSGIARPPGGQLRPPAMRAPSSQASQGLPPPQVCEPCGGASPPQTIRRPPSQLRAPGQTLPQPTSLRPPGRAGPLATSSEKSAAHRPAGLPQPITPAGIPRFGQAAAGAQAAPRLLRPPQQAVPIATAASPQGPVAQGAIPRTMPSQQASLGPRELRPPSGQAVQSKLRPPERVARPSSSSKPSLGQVSHLTVEEQVHENLLNQQITSPDGKITAKGKKVTSNICPETIETPAGAEKVIQKAVLEKRLERGAEGEKIVKNLALLELDEATGLMEKVELGMQQVDPRYVFDEGAEIVGLTSTVSVTDTYKTVSRESTRISTKPLDTGLSMSPAAVAQLIREEKEDVENTLQMVPAELVLSPGRYEMKQRLQRLRLNSESMALLEQSIIHPEPTADEAQADPTPEAMATMMHTVETGISPQAAPDQVFNSLFTETANEQYINLSSITPGPLQDVVVPSEVSKEVHKEVLTDNMSKLAEKLEGMPTSEDIPYVDIFTRVMAEMELSPGKAGYKPFQPISDERSLWVNANLEPLVNIIGAEPVDVLDPANVEELLAAGNLENEMSNGVEYYVDTNPVQYMSRVQLRGTQMPSYFPGYMVALPEFPEIVKIARSPDEVFASAWKSVQPKHFAEESMQSLSF